jgi:phosphoribosylaminoimidazole carboxylase PurE protein
MEKIAIILGSHTDIPVIDKGTAILDNLGLPYELRIISAHRTPEALSDYLAEFAERNIKVVIAAAGKAAHLPGVVASKTMLPVIGLPIDGGMDGMDALLSIVQMPKGIPVATVGVNNAQNAVLLAVQILALVNNTYKTKLEAYRLEQKNAVLAKDKELRRG